MKTADAVCPFCQRTILNGAQLTSEGWIMRKHPPACVFIDLKKSDWEQHYIPKVHGRCVGTNYIPQVILNQ